MKRAVHSTTKVMRILYLPKENPGGALTSDFLVQPVQ